MTESTLLMAVLGLVLLTACPSSKPSDNNDDAADDGDGKATETGEAAPGTPPQAAGDGDGDSLSCEHQLERVEAELAECRAKLPESK